MLSFQEDLFDVLLHKSIRTGYMIKYLTANTDLFYLYITCCLSAKRVGLYIYDLLWI